VLHILTIPTWNTCIAIWLWHVWYILRRCERCALRFRLANFDRAYFQFSIGKESIGNAWFGPVHIRIYICQWNPIVTLRIFAASVNEFFDRTVEGYMDICSSEFGALYTVILAKIISLWIRTKRPNIQLVNHKFVWSYLIFISSFLPSRLLKLFSSKNF